MNIVTVAQIKRSGFAVLEPALARGAVQLMKRNRPSAVMLRPADYEELLRLAARNSPPQGNAGLAMLLSRDSMSDGLDAAGLRARLDGLNDGWSDR